MNQPTSQTPRGERFSRASLRYFHEVVSSTQCPIRSQDDHEYWVGTDVEGGGRLNYGNIVMAFMLYSSAWAGTSCTTCKRSQGSSKPKGTVALTVIALRIYWFCSINCWSTVWAHVHNRTVTANNESVGMWWEIKVAYLTALPQNSSERTEENHNFKENSRFPRHGSKWESWNTM
jgi:hypothetical protein